jgi:protein-disulfide isomerase
MQALMAAYAGKIRYVHKHLPLQPMGMPAALRYEAIARQDKEKALRFHDRVFAEQGALQRDGETFLDAAAQDLGVNLARMRADMKSADVLAQIEADVREAESLRLEGTPGYVVGGVVVRGAYPLSHFQSIVDRVLAKK